VDAIVVAPGEGAKVLRDELTVTEIRAARGARPHAHRAHADAFYVLEGELEFAGVPLPTGGLGVAPPEVVHWFGAGDSRALNVHAPGGAWAHRVRANLEGRRVDGETIDTFDPPADAAGEPLLVLPGDGEALESDERILWIKAALPELCVFEFDAAPGYTGPKAHHHRRHVDAFHVLAGALRFELDGEPVLAGAGTFVAAPPGVVHTFETAGDERVRFLNVHAPGMRFDEYLRRQAAGEDGRRFHEAFDVYETEVS
jgi:quercetin dioxygenase-like cupin family protein